MLVLTVILAGTVSTVGHGWILLAHPHGAGLTVVIVAMTLWCAVCTVELWIRPSAHCLRRLCLMALAMVLVHAVLVAGLPGLGGFGSAGGLSGVGGHAHHAATSNASTASGAATVFVPPTDHAAAMLLLITVELGVALTAGLALRRRHSSSAAAHLAPHPTSTAEHHGRAPRADHHAPITRFITHQTETAPKALVLSDE